MIKKITKTSDGDGYPFIIPLIKNFSELYINNSIIILVGTNGCGKSTFLEIIACGYGINPISLLHDYANEEFKLIKEATKKFSISSTIKKNGFFFRGEDFIEYIYFLHKSKKEAQDELSLIKEQYKNKSNYARSMAASPHFKTIYEIDNMYKRDLQQLSHGESFIEFFKSRLRENSLYIIDEPEGPLSFINQLALISLIKEYSNKGCQFIIATHSPVLAAIPNADIYELNDCIFNKVPYEELDMIRDLKSFINNPDVFTRNL